MNAEEILDFGNKVNALEPKDAIKFMHDHGLPLHLVVAASGLGRQSPYNWLSKGTSPSLKNWRAFQTALLTVAHDRELVPRRVALNADPTLARDLRWLVELAVKHGDLGERGAARMLGLDFEAWNALPPMENA